MNLHNVTAFVQALKIKGILVRHKDGNLEIEAPQGALTPEIEEALASQKQDIILHLQHYQETERSADVSRAGEVARSPLTFYQEEQWQHEKSDPRYGALHLPMALRFRGRVNIYAIEASLGELINRHESLRTNIVQDDGQLWQTIHEDKCWKLNVVDLSDMGHTNAETEAFVRIEDERKKIFDVQQDLLISATLYVLDDHDCIFFVNVHRIVSDSWSLYILATEIEQLYTSFSRNEPHSLRPLPVQYRDFAVRRRHVIQESRFEEQRSYWSKKLKDTALLELPTDFVRAANSDGKNNVLVFDMERPALKGLFSLGAKEGVPPQTILLSAFAVFLHRYTGQDDICIGWEHSGRDDSTLSSLIGLFAHTLALRMDLSGNPSFLELLHRISEATNAACEHSDVPFEQIATILRGECSRSIAPLMQVMFAYHGPLEHGIARRDFDISMIDTLPRRPGMDLALDFVEIGDEIRGRAEYNVGIFMRDTIERMMRHFTNLLNDSFKNPDKRLGELNLMGSEERDQLQNFWNGIKTDYRASVCVHTLFEEQVEKTPDSVALMHNDLVLTYRELNEKANQLAHYLRKKGVSTETLVGLSINQSFEFVIGLLGIIKSGGAYVPLDPTCPPGRFAMMIDDCQASILITKQFILEKLPKTTADVILIDQDWKDIKHELNTNPSSTLTPDNLFYVIYTSGSTGHPKNVAGIYRGIINRLHWMWETYPFAESEVCCMKTSASFVDHVAELFGPLLKGIPLVIFSDAERQDIGKMVDIIIEKKITRIVLMPSQLQKLLTVRKEKLFPLTHIKYVFCSGEALSVRLAKQFYQDVRNARLVNIYGSTEVSADATYHEVKRFHVDDVLRYFTHSVELPGGLIDEASHRYPTSHNAEWITTADIGVDEIARKFTSSRITECPMTLEQYYKKLYDDVLPYVINTAAPTFIGHMTSALPDFVHDLSKLISQLNQNLVKLETAKSLIFLEREAIAILHRCFYAHPDDFYEKYAQQVNMNLGLVTTGGTTANITALLTARNKALFNGKKDSSAKSIYALLRDKGHQDMTILGSRLMHYSMRKASSVLGLGINTIMYVDSDREGKLDVGDLERKVEECRRRRVLVLAIVGIAGATETGQIEPLDEMGDLANSRGIHFHVDAAWGGTTILSEKHKEKLRGIHKADSITFCGHKQLYLPQGISVCLFRNPRTAQYAATAATYQASPNTYDVGRFTLEGSRSAISLCLHAALRLIGKRGYESLVDRGIEMARFFADLVKSTIGFELIGYPELNIVNYRYIPVALRGNVAEGSLTDEDNQKISYMNAKIQERQFYKGKTFVSKTTLFHTKYGKDKEIIVFRVVLSNPLTTQADIYSVLEDQFVIAKELFGEVNGVLFGEKEKIVGKEWETSSVKERVFVDEKRETFVPIGKPLANCMVYILDRYGNPAPIGVPGEMCVAGAAVSRGYFNKPDLTAKVFIPNPFTCEPGKRLFRTGDRARFLSDGNIEYLGRNDDQVKIQGYRVEIAEIELALSEIENVQQCAVVAKATSDGNKRLIAYIDFEKGSGDIAAIRDTLTAKMPDYMVPSVFVEVEKMPQTLSGKINKKELAECEI